MKYKSLFFICFLSIAQYAIGQKQASRFSFDLNTGIPFMFGSIPSNISAYGGLGVRYNLTTALSAQFSFNIGTMKGSQEQTKPEFTFPETVSNYKSYNSEFFNYALRGQINLERVLKLRSIKLFRRMNPYLVGGIGYTSPRGEGWVAERFYNASTKKYKANVADVWTTQVGALVRIYISPMVDLNIGSEFNHCQTYYLDGIYPDKQYDHYLTNYIGVNIKLGATKENQHIEWQNVVLRERKPRKQPKDKIDAVDPINVDEKPIVDSPINVEPTQVEPTQVDSSIAVDTASLIVETKPKDSVQDEVIVPPIIATKPKKDTLSVAVKPTLEQKTGNNFNAIAGVADKTPGKYTVISGAYSVSKIEYAYAFRDLLRKQGYEAAIVKSDINPKIVRVMIFSSDNKKAAVQQCNKVRKSLERNAWISIAK